MMIRNNASGCTDNTAQLVSKSCMVYIGSFQETPMPKQSNLSAMSVDQLLKLRSDVELVLTRRAAQLRDDLSKLSGSRGKVGAHPLAGRKAPVKYRDKAGNTWAGRGAKPRWLVAAINRGKKLDDFLIDKSARKGRRKRRSKR